MAGCSSSDGPRELRKTTCARRRRTDQIRNAFRICLSRLQLQAPTVPESVRADVFSMAERGERPTELVVKTMISEAKWKRDEERRETDDLRSQVEAEEKETAEQAERDRRSLHSSKKYKERMAAEREAAQAEAEKRAAEEKAAAQQAAELVGKALAAPDVQVLIASIEKSGAWLFVDALRRQLVEKETGREVESGK